MNYYKKYYLRLLEQWNYIENFESTTEEEIEIKKEIIGSIRYNIMRLFLVNDLSREKLVSSDEYKDISNDFLDHDENKYNEFCKTNKPYIISLLYGTISPKKEMDRIKRKNK